MRFTNRAMKALETVELGQVKQLIAGVTALAGMLHMLEWRFHGSEVTD